jgi:signal transduction histidine kinase
VPPPPEPNWPRLLSLAVHEFRTPLTVVAGYLRMVLNERAGPLAEMQRKLLEEAEKSTARLSTLLGEMSEIGQLEDGRQSLSRTHFDLADVVAQVVARVEPREGDAGVVLEGEAAPLPINGDQVRLARAIHSIVSALRREIIDEGALVVSPGAREAAGRRVAWIVFGTRSVNAALRSASAEALGPFDEWRGGCGLSLPLARRVIEQHGGRIMALPGERQKAGGVVEMPLEG